MIANILLGLISLFSFVKPFMTEQENVYNFEVTDMENNTYTLEEYKGKVILVVNVASKCGLADKSYQELAKILSTYNSDDIKVLLFPCDQFAKQEYKTREEIKQFAATYSDEFILMAPVDVKGQNMHPLFKFLCNKLSGFITDGIKWNFTYFLIDRQGIPVKRYSPIDSLPVNDKMLVKCINEGKNSKMASNSA